jgi:anti-sigma factor RsiW
MSDMDHEAPLTSEQRENLVAYLDGELDDAGVAEVEKLLATNPEARHAARMLSESFDMLDLLPRERASDTFTTRTLATVRVSDLQPATGFRSRQMRRKLALSGFAVGLACSAIAGFLITNRWLETESDLLVEDLPVIQNLDMYSDASSVELLRALERDGMFNEPLDLDNL